MSPSPSILARGRQSLVLLPAAAGILQIQLRYLRGEHLESRSVKFSFMKRLESEDSCAPDSCTVRKRPKMTSHQPKAQLRAPLLPAVPCRVAWEQASPLLGTKWLWHAKALGSTKVDRRGFAFQHGKLTLSGPQLVNLRGDSVQLILGHIPRTTLEVL